MRGGRARQLDAAAHEFADTEQFLQVAERLVRVCTKNEWGTATLDLTGLGPWRHMALQVTPYAWGRYDLLVMPPSFPYGGRRGRSAPLADSPSLTRALPANAQGWRTRA